MASIAKAHIDRIHQERITNQPLLDALTDIANFAVGTLSGRFFNEVTQNADDAGATSMSISLSGRRLTIVHDGRHFNATDVDKVVSFANQRIRDKSQNSQATGYKGIGFKALIAMATRVDIISQYYTFRFDKSFWGEKQMPWEMIPIWTEVASPQTNLVTFVLELINPASVAAELKEVLKQPKALLFLRNIRVLTVSLPPQTSVVKRIDAGVSRQLVAGGVTLSDWSVQVSPEIPIPEDVSKSLQTLNTTLCPDRLKQAKSVSITFAYPTAAQGVVVQTFDVYCTLPTKLRLGLPFAVNAEFIMEPQREQLVSSPWNVFLFKCLGWLPFYFMATMARGEKWKQVLSLMGSKTIVCSEATFQQAYKDGFQLGSDHYAWIPARSDPKKLLKLADCYIDEMGFYTHFEGRLPHAYAFPHPELEQREKLHRMILETVPTHVLTSRHVLEQLESIFKPNPDPRLCYECLMFLSTRLNPNMIQVLKEIAWIPTEHGTLAKLSEVTLPPTTSFTLPPASINIPIMHRDILALDTTGALRKWLSYHHVEGLSPKNIVHVLAHQTGQITEKNSMEIIRYVFDLYSAGHIRDEDLRFLSKMPVMSRSGKLAPVNTLFIPSEYNATRTPDLNQLFQGAPELFIETSYVGANQRRDLWDQFFQGLGGKIKCDLMFLDRVTIGELKGMNLDYIGPFLDMLASPVNAVIKRVGHEVQDGDIFTNFVAFPYLRFLKNPMFARHMWHSLSQSEQKFHEVDQKCQARRGNKKAQSVYDNGKLSYLPWILRSYPLIEGTDGKMYPSGQLYSPDFRGVDDTNLVAAKIDVPLSSDLIDDFGFKTTIPASACYALLVSMRKNQIKNLKLYALIIKALVEEWQPSEKLRDWYFIAADNSWQRVDKLDYFGVKGHTAQTQSARWFKEVSNIEAVAKIFGRPSVQEIVVEKDIVAARPDQETKEMIFERLPLIAIAYGKQRMQEPLQVLMELVELLGKLQIFIAAAIPSIEDSAISLELAVLGTRLYHTADCRTSNLYERIGELLGLEDKKDVVEILKLVNKQSTRKRKTVEDWLREHKVSEQEVTQLRQALEKVEISPTIEADVVEERSSDDEKNAAPTGNHEDAQQDLSNLTDALDTQLTLSPPANLQPPRVARSAASATPPVSPRAPTKGFQSDSPRQVSTVRTTALVGSAARQNRDAPINTAAPVSPRGQPAPTRSLQSFSPKPASSTAYTSPDASLEADIDMWRPSASPIPPPGRVPIIPKLKMTAWRQSAVSDPSPQAFLSEKSLNALGHWGEEFAFHMLVQHYQSQLKVRALPLSGSTYVLRAPHVEIKIEWLNAQGESQNPYDMIVHKTRTNDKASETIWIEVKATQGAKPHFFMSQREWEMMNASGSNYEVYVVLNGGKPEASLIQLPRGWHKHANVKEHKKFEVSLENSA